VLCILGFVVLSLDFHAAYCMQWVSFVFADPASSGVHVAASASLTCDLDSSSPAAILVWNLVL
jgi:hypothetical protein